MKIGIVCPYNIFKPGGVQQHVFAHAGLLRARGHNVDIITPKPYRIAKASVPKGVIFIGGSARVRSPSATSADVSISVDNEAIEAVLANDYDVIHVHEPLVPVLARQILSRANCLRVGTFHAAMPGNVLGKSLASSYKVYARSVLPYVDVITAVSPAAVGFIQDYLDEGTTINYVPNGITLSHYKNNHAIRNRNQILYIGRLEKRKGALYTLKAFQIMKQKNPKLELLIAGDGPLRESLENYVSRHGIHDVSFLGFIDEKQKIELLSKCGIFTSPALYGESFGIVLTEAMALGAPIVAHNNDGYSWVLGETGRLSLVNVEDSDSYAAKMQLMLEDDGLRKVWQDWAAKYVAQFDYEKIVDSYEALYKTNLA